MGANLDRCLTTRQYHRPKILVDNCPVDSKERAVHRAILLIRQLADEYGGPRQWGVKTKVAQRTGISSDYVTKILNRARVSLGLEAIETIGKKVGVRREFFYDDTVRDPHYRDYLIARVLRERPDHFVKWQAGALAMGLEVPSEVEEQMLESGLRMGVQSPEDWMHIYRIIMSSRRGKAAPASPDPETTAEVERLGLKRPQPRKKRRADD